MVIKLIVHIHSILKKSTTYNVFKNNLSHNSVTSHFIFALIYYYIMVIM